MQQIRLEQDCPRHLEAPRKRQKKADNSDKHWANNNIELFQKLKDE